MKRAERRHHENRVKNMWRRRVRLWRIRSPEDAERIALRRSHHPTCPCGMCGFKGARRPELPWEKDAGLGGSEPGANDAVGACADSGGPA